MESQLTSSQNSFAASDSVEHQDTVGTNEEHPAPALADNDHSMEKGSIPEKVGGSVETPAFCLLEGIVADESEFHHVKIPVACLPATLGRQHATEDSSFVPLRQMKALSRQVLRIEYRTKDGVLNYTKNGFVFQKDTAKPDFISPLPSTEQGFFAVTSLGKNSILVNGEKLCQGQSARLSSGDAIKMLCYSLYFLLPKQPSKKSMEITMSSPKVKVTKRPAPAADVEAASQAIAKKQKKSVSSSASGKWPNIQAELDDTDTTTLLAQFVEAADNGKWERRQHLTAATLACRAVLACADDPEIQQTDIEMTGVSRGVIIKWIEESDEFGDWTERMKRKMEMKSYTSCMTKALCKEGFERTSNAGRYIRWRLPGGTSNALGTTTNQNASDDDKSNPDDEEEKGEESDGDDESGSADGTENS